MDAAYIARYKERSAYEAARPTAGGVPQAARPPARPLHRPGVLRARARVTCGSGCGCTRPTTASCPTPGSYKLCDIAGAPVLLVRGDDGDRPGLLQRLPPPWRAGRAGRRAGRPACSCASSTRGATTSAATSCGCPTSVTSSVCRRRSAACRRCAASGGAGGTSSTSTTTPMPLAGVARTAADGAGGAGRGAAAGDRHQDGHRPLQLEDPRRGLPRGVPRPHDPPDRRWRPPSTAGARSSRCTDHGHQSMISPVHRRRDAPGTTARLLPAFDGATEMFFTTNPAHGIFPNVITPLDGRGFPFLVFWPGPSTAPARHHVVHADWGDGTQPNAEQWAAPPRPASTSSWPRTTPNLEPIQRSMESAAHGGQVHQLPGATHLARPGLDRQDHRARADPRAPAGARPARGVARPSVADGRDRQ